MTFRHLFVTVTLVLCAFLSHRLPAENRQVTLEFSVRQAHFSGKIVPFRGVKYRVIHSGNETLAVNAQCGNMHHRTHVISCLATCPERLYQTYVMEFQSELANFYRPEKIRFAVEDCTIQSPQRTPQAYYRPRSLAESRLDLVILISVGSELHVGEIARLAVKEVARRIDDAIATSGIYAYANLPDLERMAANLVLKKQRAGDYGEADYYQGLQYALLGGALSAIRQAFGIGLFTTPNTAAESTNAATFRHKLKETRELLSARLRTVDESGRGRSARTDWLQRAESELERLERSGTFGARERRALVRLGENVLGAADAYGTPGRAWL